MIATNTRSFRSVVVAVFVIAAWGLVTFAYAQPLSRQQQKCVRAMNAATLRVAKVQGREAVRCMKSAYAHRLPVGLSATECLSADVKGRIRNAQSRTEGVAQKKCLGNLLPPFGYTSPAVANTAATSALLDAVANIFGADLDAALGAAPQDKHLQKCQQVVAIHLEKLIRVKGKEFLRCKKDVTASALAISGQSLGDLCLAAVIQDTRGKVAQAQLKLSKAVDAYCAPYQASFSSLFPGVCANDLPSCVDRIAECHVCGILDDSDALGADCDTFDNGMNDNSCPRSSTSTTVPAPTTTTTTTTTLDINECVLGLHNCHVNATCVNTPGSVQCVCNPGYEGDGVICTDIDECALGLAGCDPNATCTNLLGTFSCSCNPEYAGDGSACSPVGPEVCNNALDDDGDLLTDCQDLDCFDSPACPQVPVDPALVAPPLDTLLPSPFDEATAFLYTAATPVQVGVTPGTIAARRAAAIRGRVMDRAGSPISGVVVRIVDHPEFGKTRTRVDGVFDMAVNGGGVLVARYSKTGYLDVDRTTKLPWRDYVLVDTVVLTPLDVAGTVVDFSSPSTVQVARASVGTDSAGTRQPTLVFLPGTTASLVAEDGTQTPLASGQVRVTEYTVGEPAVAEAAMPAELPPDTSLTFAAEFSIDEALVAGAVSVVFSQPAPFYLENFLSVPVGTKVPVGFYDRQVGEWIAADDGIVVSIVAVSGGLAELDVDGSGVAANGMQLAALDITVDERIALAGLYSVGDQLWRVPIAHFTPWDCNFSLAPIPDTASNCTPGAECDSSTEPHVRCPGQAPGSIIDCENRALLETTPVAGTSLHLVYTSSRAVGRTSYNTVSVKATGSLIPSGVKRAIFELYVAGRKLSRTFDATPGQGATIVWDGADLYGRPLQGMQRALGRVGYVYNAVYMQPALAARTWARLSGVPMSGVAARKEVTLWTNFSFNLGTTHSSPADLGGVTIDKHHRYDPVGRTLFYGDGSERGSSTFVAPFVIDTYAGTGQNVSNGDGGPAAKAGLQNPRDVACAADGTCFIADRTGGNIRSVLADGTISTVAGLGDCTLDVGPGDKLYLACAQTSKVYRLESNASLVAVAGDGSSTYTGDDVPATSTGLSPSDVAVRRDGVLYIGDGFHHQVYRVGTDGIISTYAGTGAFGDSGDGGPAVAASFREPNYVALGNDGTLYVGDAGSNKIRRITPDGTISTFCGGGLGGIQDGAPATTHRCPVQGLTVLADDTVVFSSGHELWGVGADGIVRKVAGNGGTVPFDGNGLLALETPLVDARGLAVSPEGELLIADDAIGRVRRFEAFQPGFTATEFRVPSSDGGLLYVFDHAGRHLRTIDTLTGNIRWTFFYDSLGRLTRMKDIDGKITTIERDAGGRPTAIVAPFGQRTEFTTDVSGYLQSITNVASEVTGLNFDSQGLLQSMTDGVGATHTFAYTTAGELVTDNDPAGGSQQLVSTSTVNGFEVTRSTALGRVTRYSVEKAGLGREIRTTTRPNGLVLTTTRDSAGATLHTDPTGVQITSSIGYDPRFGTLDGVLRNRTVVLPSGLSLSTSFERSVQLSDPDDPLSLTSLIETTTVNGRPFVSSYDPVTRTVTATSSGGRQTATVIDATGRIVSTEAQGLWPLFFNYDALGHLSAITQGTGAYERVTQISYNTNGYADMITDALGRSTLLTRDALGRVTTMAEPGGVLSHFAYDANANVTSVTPPSRPSHIFEYTPVELVRAYSPPDVGLPNESTGYLYNVDRQVETITRPDAQTISYVYDAAGRVQSIAFSRGTTTYTYDAAGRLSEVTAPGGETLTYAYDGSLLTQTTWSGTVNGSVERTYDNDFRLKTISANGQNPVSYQYDNDGLVTQAGAMSLIRDPNNGLVIGTTLGNVTDAYEYNGFGEMTRHTASFGATVLYDLQLMRDSLGRITEKQEAVQGTITTYDYEYDAAGRLWKVFSDGTLTGEYTYDANGNRLTATGLSTTPVYDDQDRLVQYDATSYTYTADGNLLTRTVGADTTSFEYDSFGNLLSVDVPGATHVSYVIDGANRRIGSTKNGVLMQEFLYQDGWRPIAELDGVSTIVSRFVYGSSSNVPEYMIRGGSTYQLITDQANSVRLVVDVASGIVAEELRYDEWGSIVSHSGGPLQPFAFQGGLHDLAGNLVRFHARDYDPTVGRWLARDPILFSGNSGNLYEFVLGDPINFVDPSGLQEVPPEMFPGPDLDPPWNSPRWNPPPERIPFEPPIRYVPPVPDVLDDRMKNIVENIVKGADQITNKWPRMPDSLGSPGASGRTPCDCSSGCIGPYIPRDHDLWRLPRWKQDRARYNCYWGKWPSDSTVCKQVRSSQPLR